MESQTFLFADLTEAAKERAVRDYILDKDLGIDYFPFTPTVFIERETGFNADGSLASQRN